jgi:hypothetical protein
MGQAWHHHLLYLQAMLATGTQFARSLDGYGDTSNQHHLKAGRKIHGRAVHDSLDGDILFGDILFMEVTRM